MATARPRSLDVALRVTALILAHLSHRVSLIRHFRQHNRANAHLAAMLKPIAHMAMQTLRNTPVRQLTQAVNPAGRWQLVSRDTLIEQTASQVAVPAPRTVAEAMILQMINGNAPRIYAKSITNFAQPLGIGRAALRQDGATRLAPPHRKHLQVAPQQPCRRGCSVALLAVSQREVILRVENI